MSCNSVLTLGRWVLALLVCCSSLAAAAEYTLQTVAENLEFPWSVAQLPDGSYLVTERPGQLVHVATSGEKTPIGNVPTTFYAGQGGFFDVVLHPRFNENGFIYLCYASGDAEGNATAVLRARVANNRLINTTEILRAAPLKYTPQHYGGRLAFLPDETLLITTGDGFDYREQAQNLRSELGKVLRVRDDGQVPADNPFTQPGAERVWTYGHRNPQGLVVDAGGTVYLHEHGPRGGDELNLLVPGRNYGWPAITYGVDYSGAYVSPFTEAEGMEQPDWHWVPSIAPSGMTRYTGPHFPQWRGDLFVGALVNREVRHLEMEQGRVVAETALFSELGERIRDVRQLPDGYLYLLTDSESGRLLRVVPDSGD